MRLAVLLGALLLGRPAAAQPWVQQVLGAYDGPVRSGGRIEPMATTFSLAPAGRLVGRYRVENKPSFEGRLTDFTPDGPYSGRFTWTDRYGQGVVHIRFEPERGRFIGEWGIAAPTPDAVFDGFRHGAPAISRLPMPADRRLSAAPGRPTIAPHRPGEPGWTTSRRRTSPRTG